MNNKLDTFNVGGKHSDNPLGGIPMGTGANGQMNTVEEGETSFNVKNQKFIFSNRITAPDKKVITQFKLPGYVAGKSFAEASKSIDKKFEGRNDIVAKNTKEELLTRLASAQEHIKGMQVQEQNKMFLGGFNMGGDTNTLLQGAGSAGNSMDDSGFAERYNYDPKLKAQYQQMEGVKDSIAGALGPYGQAFRGIEKGGKAIGTAIGGETGGDVASGILDPFSGQMETFKNKDATGWEKAGVIAAPFLSGVIAGGARHRTEQKIAREKHIIQSGMNANDFVKGGPMTSEEYLKTLDTFPNWTEPGSGAGPEGFFKPTTTIPQTGAATPTAEQFTVATAETTKYLDDRKGDSLGKKVVNWMGDNYGNALRYAPVAMNAYQLSQLKKTPAVNYNKLDTRFKPEYVDEQAIQNIAGNEMDNQINAISQSGASEGAMRNAILGAGLNKTKGLSDAYMNADAQNRATNMKGQEFNLGIDQFNTQTMNKGIDETRADLGAYNNAKSALLGQMGTDIGNIGKEQLMKRYPKMMGLGYDWDGKYFVNKNGQRLTMEQATAQEAETTTTTNTKSMGGYLSRDVIKHMNDMYSKKR